MFLALPVMTPFPVAHAPMMLTFKSEAWPSSAGAESNGVGLGGSFLLSLGSAWFTTLGWQICNRMVLREKQKWERSEMVFEFFLFQQNSHSLVLPPGYEKMS